MNDFQISKDFNLQEFECTGKNHRHVRVDEKLVEKLQELRNILKTPLIINSAYRCPERNKQVGGAENSQHLYGKAVDVSIENIDASIETIAEIADELGFDGIGLYNTFIHLDVRGSKARWNNRS